MLFVGIEGGATHSTGVVVNEKECFRKNGSRNFSRAIFLMLVNAGLRAAYRNGPKWLLKSPNRKTCQVKSWGGAPDRFLFGYFI